MNADSSTLTAKCPIPPARALNVVMACEDYSAGMHALGVFERLFSAPGKKIPPGTQSIWKFDMLGIAVLREIAAQEAAAADLVIISMHGPGNLADLVKSWIGKWVELRSRRPGTLVLLLDDTGGEGSGNFPAEDFLEQAATSAGMEFSAHKAGGRCAFDDFELATDLGKKAQTLAAFHGNLFSGSIEQFREQSAGGTNREPGA